MDWLQALILGLVQGLTEYLPVSSSGHLEIGKVLLGPEAEAGGLTFDIVVHVATVLSTLVILWKEIGWIFKGLFKFQWNDETRYVATIVVSMIPIGIVGVFFKDSVEALFSDNVIFIVGVCLLVTATLHVMTHFFPNGFVKKPKEKVSFLDAFIIGVAQAFAVLPGLSRSGSTISTGLLLGNDRNKLAQFSFLMVIPPILGAALIDIKHLVAPSAEYLTTHTVEASVPMASLIVGFVAAFLSGCLACKWMIALVKKCKFIYFAIYCAVLGVLALYFA